MEAEGEERPLAEHDDRVALEELEHDENTDWLRGCGLPRLFAH